MQRSSAPVSNSSCSGFFFFNFHESLYSQVVLRIHVSIGTSKKIESSKRNLRFPFKKTGESETIFAAFFSSPGAGRQKGGQNAYILHERERKALICFSALERQEEKLSAEKVEIVKLRVALYEQYADGNMSKEEFIRQRDSYRAQEDERMEQIQRLRTEKNQVFQPVKKDTDNLQAVIDYYNNRRYQYRLFIQTPMQAHVSAMNRAA